MNILPFNISSSKLKYKDLKPGDVFLWSDNPTVLMKLADKGFVLLHYGTIGNDTGVGDCEVIRLRHSLHIEGKESNH